MKLLKLNDDATLSVDLKVFWVLVGNAFFVLMFTVITLVLWLLFMGACKELGYSDLTTIYVPTILSSIIWTLLMRNIYDHRFNPGG